MRLFAIAFALAILEGVAYAVNPPVPPIGGNRYPYLGQGGSNSAISSAVASYVPSAVASAVPPFVAGLYNNLINVKDPAYGAKGNCATDDTAAVQAAINATCAAVDANTGASPQLYFPPGCYLHNSPWRLACGNVGIGGQPGSVNGYPSGFKNQYIGPAMMIARSGIQAFTYGAALVGTGNSLVVPQTNHAYIALNEDMYGPIIGGFTAGSGSTTMGAYDIEFWYKTPASFPGGANSWLLSSEVGTPDPNAGTANGAFSFFTINSTKHLNVRFNLSGGSVIVDAGALSISTVYDIAGDYDGSTCRVYLNGTLGGSSACSGTVVFSPFETVTVPDGRMSQWPRGAYDDTFALPGFIDAIQFSNISRHTSNYTPPVVKPTRDAHTIMLVNFETTSIDAMQHALTSISGQGADVYMPIYGSADFAINDGLRIHDLALAASNNKSDGLAVFANKSEFDHLSVGLPAFSGFNFAGNDYWNTIHDNFVGGVAGPAGSTLIVGPMVGIDFGPGTAETLAYNNQSGGGIVCDEAQSSITDINPKCGGGQPTRYFWYCAGQCLYTMPINDVETGDTSLDAVMYFKGSFAPGHLDGGQLIATAGAPFVQFDNSPPPSITNTEFASGDGTAIPYLLHFTGGTPQGLLNLDSFTPTGPQAIAAATTDAPQLVRVNGAPPYGTVAQLPATPYVGEPFNVTDCGTCTFGATCTHSASPTFPICHEVYTGSAWVVQ